MLPSAPEERSSFYATALAALRFVEQRRPTGRRFGPEADARWSGFRGDLTTADRIDLLLRDADAEWPGAFGARTSFARAGVANDDAFGIGWEPLEPIEAEDLWRRSCALAVPTWDALVRAWAEAWGVATSAYPLGAPRAAERLVVAGPSAVASVVHAFEGRHDLAWSEHVVVVASGPSHRQLAALAVAALGSAKPGAIVTSGAEGLVGRPVVSPDASPEDAATASRSAG